MYAIIHANPYSIENHAYDFTKYEMRIPPFNIHYL